jgi:uncharacterized protein
MTINVRDCDDPEDVMDVAGAFLRAEPVLHNLILTILEGRIARPEPGHYWLALADGTPTGLAWQSPTGIVAGVVPMGPAAVDAIVAAIVDQGVDLPGVNGEAATAARFAGQWTERRGSAARPEMGMRIYELVGLVQPEGVPGALRIATAQDADTVGVMVQGFHADTGVRREIGVDEWVRLRIAAGHVWLWDHGGPVAMAAHTAPLGGGTRIQAVYTPPERRRRGFAGALVASLSKGLQADGVRVLLYTDLGNPTSNSVYRRIGFRAVGENLRYAFGGPV